MDLKKKKAKNARLTNILVILPLDHDKTALKHFKMNAKEDVRIHFLDDEHFEYNAMCTDFNVVTYVKRAIAYVKYHNITGIIYSHDMAALIAARVCEKTGLPGPTVDSVFLACHKYYSRQHDLSHIAHQVIDLQDACVQVTELNYPCHVQAPYHLWGRLQFIVHDANEMQRVLSTMRDELMQWGKMFFDFFAAYISKEKYPLAHREILIIESVMSNDKQCTVEGWVDGHGEVHIWALSDINYHQNTMQAQNCYSMPSVMPPIVQAQMVALTTQAIIQHGIRNGFFNVDISHCNSTQTYTIINVNPRAASLYYVMHKQCFDANLYKAMILLSLARDQACYQQSPITNEDKHLHKKVGALFFIVTFGKGKAAQLFDFEKAQQMMAQDDIHGMEIFVHPDANIDDHGTAGFRLAKFYAFGSSYESIHALANHWRGEVIKNIANSPYHVNVSYH